MVLGRHHHVFHSRSASQTSPVLCRIRFWAELISERFVFLNWDPFVLHHPFVPLQNTVESPMYKHSKFSFVPPLHPSSTVGNSRSRRRAVIRGSRLTRIHRLYGVFGQSQRSRAGTDKSKTFSSAYLSHNRDSTIFQGSSPTVREGL